LTDQPIDQHAITQHESDVELIDSTIVSENTIPTSLEIDADEVISRIKQRHSASEDAIRQGRQYRGFKP